MRLKANNTMDICRETDIFQKNQCHACAYPKDMDKRLEASVNRENELNERH